MSERSPTDRGRRGPLAVLVVVLLGRLISVGVSPVTATPLGSDLRVPQDTIDVASNPLEAASLGFARALEGAGSDLTAFMGSSGVLLQLDDSGHSGLSARQAVASLREFLRDYDRRSTVVSRAAPVDGSPDRGFAEIFWTARAVGTSDEVRRTLFIGFHLDGGDWKVVEVRVLP